MNKMAWCVLWILGSVFPVCAQNLNPAGHAGAPIIFMDSKLFDTRLSKELESNKEVVEVTVTGKMSLNNIAPRIDKWITVVGENGSLEVKQVEPVGNSRSFFSLASTVYSFIGMVWSERVFEPATKYNAVVYYRKDPSGESLIDRVVFTKKK